MSDSIDTMDLASARGSAFARRLYAAQPALAARVAATRAEPGTRAAMNARLDALLTESAAPPQDDLQLRRALRRLRNEVYLHVMERDLGGLADVAEVTAAMTQLAEVAVERALALLDAELSALFGAPCSDSDGARMALGVVAMGKLGGGELNVSSDIDLIFVYEDEGMTAGGERRPIACHDYFTRLARRLMGTLAERTEDGYVFRVDARLRPNGDSGPLVCSLPMLEEYFYVQGREWERYAWIKGRLLQPQTPGADAAEPTARLAQALEQVVTPFVYRRYLDFGVIDAIRGLHAQIRQEAVRRASLRPESADDVKLGRGGIREIEFSAQVLQLIRGGQEPALRVRPTLQVFATAVERGLIDAGAVAALSDAYLFLRRVEHRLQYVDDAQTHAVPVDIQAREQLAHSMGFADYAGFVAVLDAHRARVEHHFDATFSDKAETVSGDAESSRLDLAAALWQEGLDDAQDLAAGNAMANLAQLGYAAADALLGRLRATRSAHRYQSLPARARERFDTLLARALAEVPERFDGATRERVLSRFVDLLMTIGGRGAYLSLLTEFPAAQERVLRVLGASSWGATYLVRHPQLLDELLDDETLSPCDPVALRADLRERLARADGAEQQMDLLRHTHQAEVFRLLLRDLRGRVSVEQVGDELSALADTVLDVTLDVVWASLPKRHRERPSFAVIAYGKLGGKELGYASDLDLIFLYDDPHDDAPDVYARFARRLISWMSTATSAGVLFDIDLRLRPNGESGLLVTSLDAFRRYQLREPGGNTAWVWEHQALTRARFSAGEATVGAAFEAVREAVLSQPRDAPALAAEIVSMRERVLAGHPNPGTLFDLKHDRGGMVDVEFIVQYLVLRDGAHDASLRANLGNITLLRRLAASGAIDPSLAERVSDAYRRYRAAQHALRLDGKEARVAPDQVAAQVEAVSTLWRRVFEAPGG